MNCNESIRLLLRLLLFPPIFLNVVLVFSFRTPLVLVEVCRFFRLWVLLRKVDHVTEGERNILILMVEFADDLALTSG